MNIDSLSDLQKTPYWVLHPQWANATVHLCEYMNNMECWILLLGIKGLPPSLSITVKLASLWNVSASLFDILRRVSRAITEIELGLFSSPDRIFDHNSCISESDTSLAQSINLAIQSGSIFDFPPASLWRKKAWKAFFSMVPMFIRWRFSIFGVSRKKRPISSTDLKEFSTSFDWITSAILSSHSIDE